MATVRWVKKAIDERQKLFDCGEELFGIMTAIKTSERIDQLIFELSKYPTIGHPETALKEKRYFYRARNINKRFKLIYWYEEKIDVVVIADIWDTRMNPKTLAKRIK